MTNEVVLRLLPAEDKEQKFVRSYLEILTTIGGWRGIILHTNWISTNITQDHDCGLA